jgi:hypothetical protein
MDLQHAEITRAPESASQGIVHAKLSEAHHARLLQGATLIGEAARHVLSVRVGLWLDDAGRIRQARWRGSDDSSLRTCAEAACAALESGADPLQLDAASLGPASTHGAGACDGPELVLSAVRTAALLGGWREV